MQQAVLTRAMFRIAPGKIRRVVSFDFGRNLGWAVLEFDADGWPRIITSGCTRLVGWNGRRFSDFASVIEELDAHDPTAYAYEQVTWTQNQGYSWLAMYFGQQAVLEKAVNELYPPDVGRLDIHPIPTGTVKATLANDGKASKADMIEAASFLKGQRIGTDHEADAIGVAVAAGRKL